MKEFKPSNLGLDSIKENTGENERLKNFFFIQVKIEQFSLFLSLQESYVFDSV